MTLEIYNVTPVILKATVTAGAGLDLSHDGFFLSAHGDALFNELEKNASAEVVLPDLGDGTAMHAWPLEADGSLSDKWAREGTASVSGDHDDLDVDVLVVAVPPGVAVPQSPQPDGPPAPGTTQKKVKVKIGKQGSLPL